MSTLIIHPNDFGTITVIYPSGSLPVEEVALKDVPRGVPFKYIDSEALPKDRTFRNAWQYDFSTNDGIGLGHETWYALKVRAGDIQE